MVVEKNLRDKLSRVRELVPGLSEEVYALSEYMAETVNPELVPHGLMVAFILAQNDISNGVSPYTGKELSLYIREHKMQILAQKDYFVQVVDEITSSEFSEEFREIYEKVSAGNLPPKRVKTVRIDEKFPIYAEIAVQWWADALQSPRFDMGGNSELSFALQQLGMLKNKNQQASEEPIMIFKTTLAESILEEIEKWGNCELRTDYQPDQILYEASKKAKLELSFPWKTRMNITEECVSVTEPGNGKKILWQANAEG